MIKILFYLNNMKKMKLLITGSKGFIGTSLISFLNSDIYEITGIDIKDKKNLFDLNSVQGYDAVIHLAALVDVRESFIVSQPYFYINTLGTYHILNLCIRDKVRMIHISSAAVKNSYSSPYAYSKFLAEELVDKMLSTVNGVILRLENVYGLGMSNQSVFSRFLYDKKMIVYGGEETRDFISIIDVINIINAAIFKDWRNMKLEVGTGVKTKISDLAKKFARYNNKEIIYEPAIPGVTDSVANVKDLATVYFLPFVTNLNVDIENMVFKIN